MSDATDTFLGGIWIRGLDYWVSEAVPLMNGSGKKTILNVMCIVNNGDEGQWVTVMCLASLVGLFFAEIYCHKPINRLVQESEPDVCSSLLETPPS